MIKKTVKNVDEALAGVQDGMTLMVGGFGLCGIPENLIAGYKSIQNECELAKYAGVYSSNMTEILNKAEEWMAEMEKLNSV